jgi:N-acetylglucosaminyldiphosphoundecaprenol N-acetyl-beta-D-mannosaminyltransferase
MRRNIDVRRSGVVVGTIAPPFDETTFKDIPVFADRINASSPDYVWVGLGAPKQELWMRQARPYLRCRAVLGVGAVFDFVALTRRRAPDLVQACGLEWAFRLAQEPRRLGRRYALTNTTFALHALGVAHRRKATRSRSRSRP